MLTVLCCRWTQAGYRKPPPIEAVNLLRKAVKRHYPDPHEFVCVTDDASGLDPGIRVVPMWNDHANVPSPLTKGPSCYRRLKLFSHEAKDLIGERFVSVDLDCVITGDLRPLWNRPEDFVIWAGGANSETAYNGSMFMLRAGSRAKVWETFHPQRSPMATKKAGMVGSDQAWIGLCLGPKEATWKSIDGVLSFARHFPVSGGPLPKTARMVFFPGAYAPWQGAVQMKNPWIKEHWC